MQNLLSFFSEAEQNRYHRHFILPDFGVEAQTKLKKAKVLVIGAGGLSCPMLQYLAAAGVGRIGIIDADVVDISNLQRQILYSTTDIGKLKVEAAKAKLLAQNPHIEVITYSFRCTSENALTLFAEYDVIADGSDNFPTRYLANDACVLLGKPLVYAAIFRFEGQLSVFNLADKNGEFSANYRDIFPTPPAPESVPNCSEAGVLGVLPGVLGAMQANEVIKIITGIGETLAGKFFMINLLNFQTQTLSIFKDPENPLSGENPSISSLIDYEFFCGLKNNAPISIPEISPQELLSLIKQKVDFQLIDVREPQEYVLQNWGGLLIPLGKLRENTRLIARDKKVIVHCKSGKRSQKAVEILQTEFHFEDIWSVRGNLAEIAFPTLS